MAICGLAMNLNHARERIAATYDVHDYIEEKREALGRWAKYLKDLGDDVGRRR